MLISQDLIPKLQICQSTHTNYTICQYIVQRHLVSLVVFNIQPADLDAYTKDNLTENLN